MPSKEEEIQRYVFTGAYDSKHLAWPEESFFERTTKAHDELIEALFAEVQRRVKGKRLPVAPKMDLISFTRGKVEPMVRGLFPKIECDAVLNCLQKSVIFLTAENIEAVLRRAGFLHTAWDLANLYLLSAGAEMLSAKAPLIVGMSVETTCYVSLEYFVEKEKFADFVVHEAAHIFHNCHRATVGLKETRRREFLLNIEFSQRETFAYACEAYSRILELGRDRKEREALFAELDDEYLPPADEVDIEKYKTALSAAVSARNGWKQILEVCAALPLTKAY